MADKSSFPAKVLKKTLRMFMVAAALMALISLGLSRLFTEDVVLMAEKTSRETQQQLWTSYQHYYMDGGKVFRPKNKFDTVSEGQAYAMLRAVWLNDRTVFDQVYRWSETNLSRQRSHGDHLLAWRYGSDLLGGSGIIDDNSAIDADLDYALALFLAARLWPDGKGPVGLPGYREKATAVADSIMRKAVVVHPNGEFVLNPWPIEETRNPEREFLINPSYFSPVITGCSKQKQAIRVGAKWSMIPTPCSTVCLTAWAIAAIRWQLCRTGF